MKKFDRWKNDADLHNQLNRLVSDAQFSIKTLADAIAAIKPAAPALTVVPPTSGGGVGASTSGGTGVVAGPGITATAFGQGTRITNTIVPITYLVDATAGPVVQALPAATLLNIGLIIVVQKTDATVNGVEAGPNGTDTINRVNANSLPITLQNDTLNLLCVGVGAWVIF